MVSAVWGEPEVADARSRNRYDAAEANPTIFIFRFLFPDSVV
jgi:hypothetical protein